MVVVALELGLKFSPITLFFVKKKGLPRAHVVIFVLQVSNLSVNEIW